MGFNKCFNPKSELIRWCMFWPEMGLRWHSLNQPTSQPAGQIPSLTMGDSAAEAGTTLKLRMSSELKKFRRALVQAKKTGGGRNLDAAQTTNISFSLARNSTKCGSGSHLTSPSLSGRQTDLSRGKQMNKQKHSSLFPKCKHFRIHLVLNSSHRIILTNEEIFIRVSHNTHFFELSYALLTSHAFGLEEATKKFPPKWSF